MRILFVSASPLRREVSSGNTFLNLCDHLENAEFASIFTRPGNPEPPISTGFCITEKMLIQNLLKKMPAGQVVESKPSGQQARMQPANKVMAFVKRSRWTVFFWMQDLLWKTAGWKSQELERFIAEFNPDIVFSTLTSSAYLNHLILHVQSASDAKLVLYAWDGNYSLRRLMISPFRWIKHVIDRISMRKLAEAADLFYVISEIQREEYEGYFRKECKVLTKGADFTVPPERKTQYNDPMQMVFTGNVGLNRWKTLKIIADVLENINRDGIKAQLRIYTASPLTGNMKKALDRGGTSYLMGSIPASEIPRIHADADMLVHAEALDLVNKLRVRQSFSTKIVDYLKAARPILAVGPKDVASIDHLIRNDCAIAADNKAELEYKLRMVLENPAELDRVVRNAYECGRRHHNKQDIQKMLMQDLEALCGE